MPSRWLHLEFDELLREKEVIYPESNGATVHNRMDRSVKHFGSDHRELDWYHTVEAIRDMIWQIVNNFDSMSYERATDYVRIAYGHLVLDEVVTRYCRTYDCGEDEFGDWDVKEILRLAWNNYRKKGFHRTRYRHS